MQKSEVINGSCNEDLYEVHQPMSTSLLLIKIKILTINVLLIFTKNWEEEETEHGSTEVTNENNIV